MLPPMPEQPMADTVMANAPRCVGSVALVLPCLNEELAIGECVRQAIQVFEDAHLDGSVLVVDNGSVDRSVEVARAAGAHVVHQSEPGYGAALRTGFEEVSATYVVMADADGTYEMAAIPRLLKPLLDGTADLVLGSRLNDATNETMPWLHKYIGTPLITLLVNRAMANKAKLHDSQSGFRAFRREQVNQLQLASTGMEFASEMLIRCAWARLRIVEVQTTYAPRVGNSKLNTFSDGLRHLRQILLLSPEIFAIDPGLIMTGFSFVLWILASISVHGLGRIGSLSWIATVLASILSIVGPITFCTGLGIKYRAESFGYRHSPPKYPLTTLIWRFFFTGIGLVVGSVLLAVFLVVDYHQHRTTNSDAVVVVLGSVTTSAAIVGIVLTCAPILSPFLTQAPRTTLPLPDDDE
jgi:glycosyltransferase involved in cell wall biosynthesis